MEEWRPVVGYEAIASVSSEGCVWFAGHHSSDGKYLREKVTWGSVSGAYRVVTIRGRTLLVHRLVCRAFHGEARPDQPQVRHLNGIGRDNRADNLAWGTVAENAADTIAHGTNDRLNRTHCPRGHEHTDFNRTAASERAGSRYCKACHRARSWATVRGLSPKSPEARDRADYIFEELRRAAQ